MNPDEQWLLGGVGRYSITLYKESQYNSNLRLNETMELGDGNKVKLSDVMATLGSSPVAIISIQDKDNNLLVTTTLTKGVDIVTVGEKKYKFKTYKVNMDSQLNDVYLEVALVGDEVELNAGSYVNQQNIEITTTIQNSNFGIKGWTFDMKYLDFEN